MMLLYLLITAYNSINNYNKEWIIHRLDYCSPVEYREKYTERRQKEKDTKPSGNKEHEVQLVRYKSNKKD